MPPGRPPTGGTRKNVCLLCLKRFGTCSTEVGYQVRVLAVSSGLTAISEESCLLHCDLYSRFLHFTKRNFGLAPSAERFLSGAKEFQEENKAKVQVFCESCLELVGYVCDLYAELGAIKLHLLWKLKVLGEVITNSTRVVSGKLATGLVKSLNTQINAKSVNQIKVFRKQLGLKCKLWNKESTPKIQVHRGLFPEEWKFTYAATKKALMLLIVVFALATSSVYSKPRLLTSITGNNSQEENRAAKRRGRKKIVSFEGLSGAAECIVKREIVKKEDGGVSYENDDDGCDNDDGPPDNFGNDSDSDWSRGAASPTSAGSVGSDPDFAIQDDINAAPKRRLRPRRKRKSGNVTTDNETGNKDESEVDEDENGENEDAKSSSKTKRTYTRRQKDPLSCKKCDKKFIDTRGLSKHLLKIHGSHIDYSCPHCGMKFKKQWDMLVHKRKLHRYIRRELIQKKMKDAAASMSWRRPRTGAVLSKPPRKRSGSGRGKPPKETKCPKCDEVFPSISAMIQHRKKEHKIVWSKHECPICFRTVVSEERFKWHVAAHEKNALKTINLFYCEACGKHFYKESSLSEHIVKVHDGCFPCSLCEAKYPTSKFLRAHLETHETDQKNFFCTFCFRGFTNRQYFDVHRKVFHKGKRLLFCDHEACNEEFESTEDLNTHLKTHLSEAEKTSADTTGDDTGDGVGQQNECEEGKVIFTCSQCAWGFLRKSNLVLHELVHTPHNKDRKGYDCPKCGQNVRYLDTLLTHFNRLHGENLKPYKCGECSHSFSNPIWFKTHCRLHKEQASGELFICEDCGVDCLDSVSLSGHRRWHEEGKKRWNTGVLGMEGVPDRFVGLMDPASPNPSGKEKIRKKRGRPRSRPVTEEELRQQTELKEIWTKIPCEGCEETFESAYLLRKHMESTHEDGEKTISCCFCSCKFVLPQTHDLHCKAVHKSKYRQFQCEKAKCDYICGTLPDLEEHLKAHLTEDIKDDKSAYNENNEGEDMDSNPTPKPAPYTTISHCKVCNWAFIDKDYLELHELVHVAKSPGGTFNCTRCHEQMPSTGHLICHFNKNHGVNLRPYKCFECSKTFSTKCSQASHIKRHNARRNRRPDEKFECIECGANFLDDRALTRHRKTHNPDNHIQCEECEMKLPDRNLLLKHMKRVHNRGDRYPCPICGMTFIFRHYVKQHMHVHEEASFKCDECGKLFKREQTMKAHKEVIHNPDRTSYMCSECGMSYKSQSGLKFHIGSMHTEESQKEHACPHCPKRYHRKMLLRMHMKTCMQTQGIKGDNEETGGDPPKTRQRRPRQPRQPRKRRKKKESDEEEELESGSTTSEEEEEEEEDKPEEESEKPQWSLEVNPAETSSEEKPDTDRHELQPTSVSAINAIIANLTGISDYIDPNQGSETKRTRGSASRRTSTGGNNSGTLSAPTTSSLQSTVDHMLLQSMTQHQAQTIPNPGHTPYPHWLSTAAGVPVNVFVPQPQDYRFNYNGIPTSNSNNVNLEPLRFPQHSPNHEYTSPPPDDHNSQYHHNHKFK